MTDRARGRPRRYLARASVAYVVLLGALSALPPLGIDMGLPALPGLPASLAVSAARAAFPGDLGRTRQSQVTLVNAVAPLEAPLIGAAVLRVGDWRTVYVVLAVVGVTFPLR